MPSKGLELAQKALFLFFSSIGLGKNWLLGLF
jgi:hypothetical protein